MNLQNVDAVHAIFGMLFSLSNRIQTLGDKEFDDITLKQQFLMIALYVFQKPPTLREAGELIGCSYQNVKRMAEQLQKNGYLNIIQDKTDKRKLLLAATGRYKAFEEQNREKIQNFLTILYGGIPENDLMITLQTLIRMDRNIGGTIEQK